MAASNADCILHLTESSQLSTAPEVVHKHDNLSVALFGLVNCNTQCTDFKSELEAMLAWLPAAWKFALPEAETTVRPALDYILRLKS